ncbi:hypothetical protein ANAEL_03847 [Anaerolineales bacterium]|nr:hypothetical protein ANAEL_03847 [Anaerolineales bacterium]
MALWRYEFPIGGKAHEPLWAVTISPLGNGYRKKRA